MDMVDENHCVHDNQDSNWVKEELLSCLRQVSKLYNIPMVELGNNFIFLDLSKLGGE